MKSSETPSRAGRQFGSGGSKGECFPGSDVQIPNLAVLDTNHSRRKTKLGVYLLNVARLWMAMDSEPEERLLKHGLAPRQIRTERRPEPALHIRRTLDQSYFLNLKDTSHRDQDQVVYRATRLPWHLPGNLTRVVMVDQLWLWILDDCKPGDS